MHLEPTPDIFDAFLATRQGKYIVGALSVAIGLIFLLTRQMVRCDGFSPKKECTVKKYEAVVRRDVLLLLGSVALMLGAAYLVWSILAVQ